MAEVIKSSVRRGGQSRGDRNRKTATTIKSKLDKKSSTFANPAGSQAKKDVQTDWPYNKKENFPNQPKSKVGKQKPKTVDQPVYKRGVKGPADIDKSMKLSTSKRKTPSPEYGKAFTKWLGGIGDDIGEGASSVGKKVSSSDLWKKWKAQWDGSDDVPNQPPPQTRKRIERAVNMVTGKDDKKKTPYQKMDAPGKAMPPASAKKKVAKKKDISEAEANRRIAAREKEIGGHTVSTKRGPEHGGIKKAAAPSVDGRTKAVQDKEESMAGFAGDKPKEETADFKDFLSKHGGVKGFQFNLIGKNKTKEAGMKRAREAYAEEQRDRYHDKEKLNEKDEYKYGSKRRLVKKKNAGPIRSIGEQMKSIPGQIKATRKIKNKKAQGGTIRLKTGGAVIDPYDYN